MKNKDLSIPEVALLLYILVASILFPLHLFLYSIPIEEIVNTRMSAQEGLICAEKDLLIKSYESVIKNLE